VRPIVPIYASMRQDRKRFEGFLWGQVLLFGLLGATLALFLAYPRLRAPYSLPELKLVLATIYMLGGALVAVLTANRLAVEGRRYDLLLCCGFLVTSLSWLVFSITPTIAHAGPRPELWVAIAGQLTGWALIAAAPFMSGRVHHRRAALGSGIFWSVVALTLVWLCSRSLGIGLPNLDPTQDPAMPASLTGALAATGLLNLLALVGFGSRFLRRDEDLDYWLAIGATLMLFSSLHFIFSPLVDAGDVSQGDYLRVLAYGVLLVGVWRAMRNSEFGRAVAEERARVAREIHDGLAQYLFTISTHASMLEGGADPAVTLPRLKEAALAAQQEARYAILALSSASGRSPFDAALRRYVDFLTADGELEVELEIDPSIVLGPDEQIELFRIVQEGLSNARKHAGAAHAWLEIGLRGGNRFVAIRDDGVGFASDESGAGQGLRNMRERAASIDGAFTLRSTPGAGTALEIVLRT
jgi:signal transduction histidine kinase